MIETCRCENAFDSALSMAATSTPMRAAAARSICTSACGPARSWSLFTSASPGVARSLSANRAVHSRICSRSCEITTNWYSAPPLRAPPRKSCAAASTVCTPPTAASLSRSRSITEVAVRARGLEADEQLPAVRRTPAGRDTHHGADVVHRRVAQDGVDDALLALRHRAEGDVGRGDGGAVDQPGVLLGHQAFRQH